MTVDATGCTRKSRKRQVGGLLDSDCPTCCTEEIANTLQCSVRAAEIFAASGKCRGARIGRVWRLNRADVIHYFGLDAAED